MQLNIRYTISKNNKPDINDITIISHNYKPSYEDYNVPFLTIVIV